MAFLAHVVELSNYKTDTPMIHFLKSCKCLKIIITFSIGQSLFHFSSCVLINPSQGYRKNITKQHNLLSKSDLSLKFQYFLKYDDEEFITEKQNKQKNLASKDVLFSEYDFHAVSFHNAKKSCHVIIRKM